VRFSVIIPVWNQLHFSKKLAECLGADHPGDWETVWINNGSTDGTAGFLRDIEGPGNRFVEFDENRGFGAACNAGAGAAEGTYLVFLNNDTEPEPGMLSDLVARLEADPTIGALLPRVTEAANLSFKRADPSKGVEQMRPFGRIPSGVCVAMEKGLFFELGCFDLVYGLASGEDADLFCRVWQAGRHVSMHHGWCLKHVGHGTTPLLPNRSELFRKNRDLFNERWGKLKSAAKKKRLAERTAGKKRR